MKNLRIIVLLVAISLALCPSVGLFAARQGDMYEAWADMPAKELLARGNAYFFNKNQKPDSSLVCFSILANRLAKADGRVGRRNLAEAEMGLWMVYFFAYDKSFDHLQRAKDAAVGMDDLMARVHLSYGNVYQTLASQYGDSGFTKKASDS